ncbi:MAG: hypothetical protein BJ554DRAFT_4839 [Olpidium bornovanus]|uniref:Uncharacterized protein n=1 Tax=Olpidium bornovanus TaxID=278681 RepID=A0A8H8DEY6_9FUNG|nr:MAG: hypothetical protein BJ554DRAFT_4839 [Olpidium bornovanus]
MIGTLIWLILIVASMLVECCVLMRIQETKIGCPAQVAKNYLEARPNGVGRDYRNSVQAASQLLVPSALACCPSVVVQQQCGVRTRIEQEWIRRAISMRELLQDCFGVMPLRKEDSLRGFDSLNAKDVREFPAICEWDPVELANNMIENRESKAG